MKTTNRMRLISWARFIFLVLPGCSGMPRITFVYGDEPESKAALLAGAILRPGSQFGNAIPPPPGVEKQRLRFGPGPLQHVGEHLDGLCAGDGVLLVDQEERHGGDAEIGGPRLVGA